MSSEKEQAVREQITELESLGIIRKCDATAYSHVLMVRKPNGTWRMCIDFRNQDECTKPLNWPLPNINQMLDRLGSKRPKFFGVIELTSGYHQAPMHENSIRFTAFITYLGIYEWCRVPMGLKGAPSYFQKMMTESLAGLLGVVCELYLDNIIIFGFDETSYLNNLR